MTPTQKFLSVSVKICIIYWGVFGTQSHRYHRAFFAKKVNGIQSSEASTGVLLYISTYGFHIYLIRIFTEKIFRNRLLKSFPKKAIEIWILIPIIPRDMFKLHAKKSFFNLYITLIFQSLYHTSLISPKEFTVAHATLLFLTFSFQILIYICWYCFL